MTISKEFIKNTVSIVDLLNQYGIEINRKNFIVCPFHDEKTPSCEIYPDTNTFYCWGCNSTGDVIKFVQLIEQKSFPDAIQAISRMFTLSDGESPKIAFKTAISKPKPKPAPKEPTPVSQSTKDIYKYFLDLLSLTGRGFNYLTGRGFSVETLTKFKIKSIDNPDKVFKQLKEKFSFEALESAGLINKKGGFAFFLPCVVFPHIDKDEVVYFSNRNFSGKVKSFKLSGVKQRYFLGDTSKNKIRIFEGVLDALSYYELFQDDNFIVLNGIAGLTPANYQQTLNIINPDANFILAFDNDQAGKNATKEIINLNKGLTIHSFKWESFFSFIGIDKPFERLELYPVPCKDLNDALRIYKILQGNKPVFNFYLANASVEDFETWEEKAILMQYSNKSSQIEAEQYALFDCLFNNWGRIM